jgi:hypothetical protein
VYHIHWKEEHTLRAAEKSSLVIADGIKVKASHKGLELSGFTLDLM